MSRRSVIDRCTARSDDEYGELGEIEAAMARIANGVYGLCESCGCALGRLRLRAVPEARKCESCSSVTTEGSSP